MVAKNKHFEHFNLKRQGLIGFEITEIISFECEKGHFKYI